MARLPFTDSHVHFHDLDEPSLRYAWLAPEAPPDPILGDHGAIKARRYWADDFLAETRFHNVERVIHVEAAAGTEDPVEETRWLQAFADRLGVPHGIVAHAGLADPGVLDTLERHAAFANLRGIRDRRFDDYLTNSDWRRGYALLAEFGLVCCGDPLLEHMGAVRRLADDFPEVVYCVDHAGFPRARDPDTFEAWRKGMRTIAGAPNTVVKISGLGMCDHRWTVDSLRPWVLECIDAFGTDRSFFGTNWTVDRLFSSYGDVVDAYAEIIAGFSESEQSALFSENANRVFRLV